MVTVLFYTGEYSATQDGLQTRNDGYVREVRCLSTDTKPTTVPNGTTCIEIDTGDVYIYDSNGQTWNVM